ncbi:reductase, partial [Streptomyces sp. NPDC059631]
MRLLVLGGSDFAGRAVVEAAAGRGWDVTVLNRGRRPAAAPGVRGDGGAPTAPHPEGGRAAGGRGGGAGGGTWG